MNSKQNFPFSNISVKLCKCIIQLHETAPSCDNNFAFNLTEMFVSKMYQTSQVKEPNLNELGNTFILNLAFPATNKFSFPLISQVSVVELTFLCFLDPCNSFMRINLNVHIEIRLQFCVQTATFLRLAQSVISWKRLHEFKAQFLQWCFNLDFYMACQRVSRLHETRPLNDEKFAFTLTEMCLLNEKMYKAEIRPRSRANVSK